MATSNVNQPRLSINLECQPNLESQPCVSTLAGRGAEAARGAGGRRHKPQMSTILECQLTSNANLECQPTSKSTSCVDLESQHRVSTFAGRGAEAACGAGGCRHEPRRILQLRAGPTPV